MFTDQPSGHDKRKTRLPEIINSGQDSDVLGVCIRDESGMVLHQNPVSKNLCGDQTGLDCGLCNVDSETLSPLSLQPEIQIAGHACQGVTFHKNGTITTLFSTRAQDNDALIQRLKTCNLTAKEAQVAQLVLSGKPNHDICQALKIKESTLKTHLNHLYQKAPFMKNKR